MRAKKQTLSIWQLRARVDQAEEKEFRQHIRQLPLSIARAVVQLRDRANATGLGEDPRWNGIVLVVKHLSEGRALFPAPDARTLAYTRAACAELSRHPGLIPARDNKLHHMDLDVTQLYNALQFYLGALEAVVGKDADLKRAAS